MNGLREFFKKRLRFPYVSIMDTPFLNANCLCPGNSSIKVVCPDGAKFVNVFGSTYCFLSKGQQYNGLMRVLNSVEEAVPPGFYIPAVGGGVDRGTDLIDISDIDFFYINAFTGVSVKCFFNYYE